MVPCLGQARHESLNQQGWPVFPIGKNQIALPNGDDSRSGTRRPRLTSPEGRLRVGSTHLRQWPTGQFAAGLQAESCECRPRLHRGP